jgi:uncharacterized protein (TIGR02145 family)
MIQVCLSGIIPTGSIIKKNCNMANQKRFLQILCYGIVVLLFIPGCSKKDNTPTDNTTLPAVTTDTITAITLNEATCGGNVTSDGGAPVTQRGICWSKTADPKNSDAHTLDGSGTGTFISQITGLDTNSLYYVRAYATNTKGTSYGLTRSFTTGKLMIYGSVADIDGNIYQYVRIGHQYWMNKNLRVIHYRNGEAIPNIASDVQWKNLITGAYCVYDNPGGADTTFGNLYNWHALSDVRGLCPDGWHVPTNTEWDTLGAFLGGNAVAGGKLKSTGTIEDMNGLWYSPNTDATNSSYFSALPGGYRINYGTFYSQGNVGYFWTLSDTASVNAWNYILDANNGELKRNFNLKTNGFSVRCCKD